MNQQDVRYYTALGYATAISDTTGQAVDPIQFARWWASAPETGGTPLDAATHLWLATSKVEHAVLLAALPSFCEVN